MSENNDFQSEQELWDVLMEPLNIDAKPERRKTTRPKTGPKFASKAPVRDVPAAPVPRKTDSFFFACMAGVAAVSVAATLFISGMLNGAPSKEADPGSMETNPPAASTAPVIEENFPDSGETPSSDATLELEQENSLLREEVQMQKNQILNLESQIMELEKQLEALSNSTVQLPANPSDPKAAEAIDIFNQIKTAYANSDRDALDRLMPEMDKRLSYLSTDALNEYYLILEYLEMPVGG